MTNFRKSYETLRKVSKINLRKSQEDLRKNLGKSYDVLKTVPQGLYIQGIQILIYRFLRFRVFLFDGEESWL